MREPDPYLVEEQEFHLCDVTKQCFPESEMIYDSWRGVWFLKEKESEYLKEFTEEEKTEIKKDFRHG